MYTLFKVRKIIGKNNYKLYLLNCPYRNLSVEIDIKLELN